MEEEEKNKQHIITFKEHFGTWLALIVLTVMMVSISVFGADLLSLTAVATLAIATTQAIVVGYYLMHLKYEPKLYQLMIVIIILLFIIFMALTIF